MEFCSMDSERNEDRQCMTWNPGRCLLEDTEWSWSLRRNGDQRVAEVPGPWDVHWVKLQAWSGAGLRRWLCVLQMAGVELAKPLKHSLLHHMPPPPRPDSELQELMFSLLDVDLALVWPFFAVPWFLPFGIGIFTLCWHILKYGTCFSFYRCSWVGDVGVLKRWNCWRPWGLLKLH